MFRYSESLFTIVSFVLLGASITTAAQAGTMSEAVQPIEMAEIHNRSIRHMQSLFTNAIAIGIDDRRGLRFLELQCGAGLVRDGLVPLCLCNSMASRKRTS